MIRPIEAFSPGKERFGTHGFVTTRKTLDAPASFRKTAAADGVPQSLQILEREGSGLETLHLETISSETIFSETIFSETISADNDTIFCPGFGGRDTIPSLFGLRPRTRRQKIWGRRTRISFFGAFRDTPPLVLNYLVLNYLKNVHNGGDALPRRIRQQSIRPPLKEVSV